ncbi:MAG: hypothetical protein AAFX08_01995 [Pseudomonadota bacterium]
MTPSIVAAMLLAQAGPAVPSGPPDIIRPDPYADCVCADGEPSGVIEIDGLVQDAELRLGPDGRSVLPEQATIFQIISSTDEAVSGQAKVHHPTRPSECGLTFDYGKRYKVRALREGDRLVSNYCLDPRRTKAD